MLMTTDELKTVRKWLLYHLDLVDESNKVHEFSYHLPASLAANRPLGINANMVFNSDLLRVLRLLVLEADAEAELSGYHEKTAPTGYSAKVSGDWCDGKSLKDIDAELKRQALTWLRSERDKLRTIIVSERPWNSVMYDKGLDILSAFDRILSRYKGREEQTKEQIEVGANAHSFHNPE